jgi:hypothetical protein
MATEKLKFKLELYAHMWDKPPHVEILVNNKIFFDGDVTGSEETPSIIEFETELEENKSYDFVIKRSGKDKDQTVVKEGKIVKDQLLIIKRIDIDDIDIGALVYEGMYTPEYPEPWATQQREAGNDLKDSFKNVTQMGFNGTWSFKFSSPFYMWLLENLY